MNRAHDPMIELSNDAKRGVALGAALCLLAAVVILAVLAGRWWRDDDRRLERFVNRYFASWSDQRMADYRACFIPDAEIHFITREGARVTFTLDDFMRLQARAHANAPEPMREVPTRTVIRRFGSTARVEATWALTRADGVQTGTDWFTMTKTDAGWKIRRLVFATDG